jgi:hypothetical protein
MTVRAKFQLAERTDLFWGGGARLKFHVNYDPTIPEDQRFAKATPSGEFTIHIDNPLALAQFKLGDYYYVDFNPVMPAEATDGE